MALKGIVTKDWLRKNIGNPKVKILDCSWYMAALNHPVEQDFIDNRIKGVIILFIFPSTFVSHSLRSC
jgi:3-mercaptopyruvate sulfurtransferase SseA